VKSCIDTSTENHDVDREHKHLLTKLQDQGDDPLEAEGQARICGNV
jgi:hypothetical protein